jgi:hypothetical protein
MYMTEVVNGTLFVVEGGSWIRRLQLDQQNIGEFFSLATGYLVFFLRSDIL